jgi:hypothetical protein
MQFYSPSYVPNAPSTSPIRLDHPNHIWRGVQIMTFLIMHLSATSSCFPLICPNIFVSTLFSNTLSHCSSPREAKFRTNTKQQAKLQYWTF